MTNLVRVGVVHVHSHFSHDCRDSLERLREFALERGISFIGLTDHAEDLEDDDFDLLTGACRTLSDERVELIPGLEFRFPGYSGLHLLALGLRRWITPGTPADFMRQTLGVAEFTIVAHPVLPDYRVPEEVRAGIDAIEVWNASYNTRYLPDPRAIRLLHEMRRTRPEVVGIAGLDQHDASNDRGTRVILEPGTMGEPLAALKAGRFTNQGVTMRFEAAAPFGPTRLGALQGLRFGLDVVNAVHERAVRLARRFG